MRLKVSFSKAAGVHCPLGWVGPAEVLSCNDQNQLIKWSTAARTEPIVVLSLPKDFTPTDLHVLATSRAIAAGQGNNQGAKTATTGELVLISSSDGRFLIVNKANRIEKNVLAHSGPIASGRWSNDATSFLTAGEDAVIKLWSKSGMLRSTVQCPGPVRVARWSPNSNAILYATGNHLTIKPLAPNSKVVKWSAHDGLVLCAAWSSVSGVIASGGEDCRYKVWDQSGAMLFQSMDSHAIVACDFSTDGEFLLLGSFNVMRLCNSSGSTICSSFCNQIGSVFSIAWAGDGTQFVAECGTGSVAFGSIVEQQVLSRNLHATLKGRRTIWLENILSKTKDILEFSDRVTKFDLAYGHLVVALAGGQLQVFNENYINTPVYIDGRVDVRIMELGHKTFLIVDGSGIWVYSYSGGMQLSPRFPGSQSQLAYLTKNCISLGTNLLAVRDALNHQLVYIFDHLPGATRQDIPHKFECPGAVAALALSRAATPNDQYLVLVDESGDLYISAVRSPNEYSPRKIGGQVGQIMWAAETNILVTLSAGAESYSVWYCPGGDVNLVAATTETKELDLGRRQQHHMRLASFEGPVVTMRNGTANAVVAVNMYAELLHRFVAEGQWTQCLKICRVAQNGCLWGTLAEMSCASGQVEVAEEAFAAIPHVDKVNYLRGVRERGLAGANNLGQIQANMLNGRVMEAETQLVNGKRFEEAINLQCALFNWTRAMKLAEEKQPQMKDQVEAEKRKYLRAIENEGVD